MSSEHEISLYKRFYLSVENIFIKKNLFNKLQPLNLEHDKLFISVIFRSISDEKDPDFTKWNKDEWIESMKIPEISLLSFLYKKQITINKIYNMTSNEELKNNLLDSYKHLVRVVKFLEGLENASNLFVDKSVNLEKIRNKKLEIALNIKNYKNPKNLANIIDLLYYKEFRNYLLETVLKGIHSIDINALKSFNIENNFYLDLIEKYCTRDNISKFFIFIMSIEIKGDVFAHEITYSKIKDYINGVIKDSEQIQKLFKHIEKEVKNSKINFKNELNLIIVQNTNDFVKQTLDSKNKLVLSSDLIKKFNIFTEGQYVKFTSIDFIKRIRLLILILIQKTVELSSLPKKEKVMRFNNFIKDNVISSLDNKDFVTLDKELYEESNDSSLKTELISKVKEMVKELIDSISEDENIKEIIKIKDDFIENLKYLIELDFSKIKKEEFNIVYNLAEKVFEKPDKIKFLLIKILNADIIKKYISKFEKDSALKINPEIKEKISSVAISALKELTDMLVKEKDLTNFKKFAFFISKIIDYCFYYILRLRSSNLESNISKTKKIIVQSRR